MGSILVGLLLALPGFLLLIQTTLLSKDDGIAVNATLAFLIGMAITSVASVPKFVRSIPKIIPTARTLWFARRRWLRFSVRTMFVLVTLLCIYLGWVMNWEWKRQAYLKENDVAGPYLNDDGSEVESVLAPWSLRIFADKGVPILYLYPTEEQELIRASRLFPEAKVCFVAVMKDGVFAYTVLIDDELDFNKLPYYKNGVLFQKELLLTVPAPK